MNREDFQKLAIERLSDAEALLERGRFAGAYYLAGYAIECALKACIAKQTRQFDFPDKKRTDRSYTHNLEDLRRLAGLEVLRGMSPTALLENWAIVDRWNEEARYANWSPKEGKDLIAAIKDNGNGVLPRIMRYW